jgi:hypothetical protein
VVEGVDLVASGFQFFTRLAAVFADEAGRFIFGIIQLCVAILGLRIIGVAISYFKIWTRSLPLPNNQC